MIAIIKDRFPSGFFQKLIVLLSGLIFGIMSQYRWAYEKNNFSDFKMRFIFAFLISPPLFYGLFVLLKKLYEILYPEVPRALASSRVSKTFISFFILLFYPLHLDFSKFLFTLSAVSFLISNVFLFAPGFRVVDKIRLFQTCRRLDSRLLFPAIVFILFWSAFPYHLVFFRYQWTSRITFSAGTPHEIGALVQEKGVAYLQARPGEKGNLLRGPEYHPSFGPVIELHKGDYEAIFEIKTEGPASVKTAEISACARRKDNPIVETLASKMIYVMPTSVKKWRKYTINFQVPDDVLIYELRCFVTGAANVKIRSILVKKKNENSLWQGT